MQQRLVWAGRLGSAGQHCQVPGPDRHRLHQGGQVLGAVRCEVHGLDIHY